MPSNPKLASVSSLIIWSQSDQTSAIFRVQKPNQSFEPSNRLVVEEIHSPGFDVNVSSRFQDDWLWAIPKEPCGDSLDQYHPKFVMAVLSSFAIKNQNSANPNFLDWHFPAIDFTTDEWTRRSMTLNGMRMSTEHFATGSLRVLQLIEQRLAAGQSDVVHDVVVYLMQQILELRASMNEECTLQAESFAAYLGIDAHRVEGLLFDWPLQDLEICQQIEAGFAGAPRPMANIYAFIENQLARLSQTLQELKNQENKVFLLLDQVILKLYNS